MTTFKARKLRKRISKWKFGAALVLTIVPVLLTYYLTRKPTSIHKNVEITSELITDATSMYLLRNKHNKKIYCLHEMFLQLTISNDMEDAIYVEQIRAKILKDSYKSELTSQDWQHDFLYEGGAEIQYNTYSMVFDSSSYDNEISILRKPPSKISSEEKDITSGRIILEIPPRTTEFIHLFTYMKSYDISTYAEGGLIELTFVISKNGRSFRFKHITQIGLIYIGNSPYISPEYMDEIADYFDFSPELRRKNSIWEDKQ